MKYIILNFLSAVCVGSIVLFAGNALAWDYSCSARGNTRCCDPNVDGSDCTKADIAFDQGSSYGMSSIGGNKTHEMHITCTKGIVEAWGYHASGGSTTCYQYSAIGKGQFTAQCHNFSSTGGHVGLKSVTCY